MGFIQARCSVSPVSSDSAFGLVTASVSPYTWNAAFPWQHEGAYMRMDNCSQPSSFQVLDLIVSCCSSCAPPAHLLPSSPPFLSSPLLSQYPCVSSPKLSTCKTFGVVPWQASKQRSMLQIPTTATEASGKDTLARQAGGGRDGESCCLVAYMSACLFLEFPWPLREAPRRKVWVRLSGRPLVLEIGDRGRLLGGYDFDPS